MPVIEAIEHNGQVIAKSIPNSKIFAKEHSIIDHNKEYVNGEIHTNTIEGFW